MVCPECGKELNGNEKFCNYCGKNLDKKINFCNNCGKKLIGNEKFCDSCGKNLNESIRQKVKNHKFKKFLFKHKKKFIISLSAIMVLIISLVLFNCFYDFTKISWDMENGSANIDYTSSTTLTLNVLAYDRNDNPITDITFSVDGGEVVADGASVKWTLPEEDGKYTITAKSPSGKKITKEINVINVDADKQYLYGVVSDDVDDTITDNDNDGFMNSEEDDLGTNKNSADTDKDGINDYCEVNETKTDPLKIDTDGDGINDGDELDLGLDPLKKDSNDDGINDGDMSLNYSITEDDLGVSIDISGKGNIASSTIDIFKNTTFESMDGIINKVYNFYSTGTIENATVKIKYDLTEVEQSGLNEDNLTLYYFNEETKELEAVSTTIDKENKLLVADLNHFSKYVIGDKDIVLTNADSQIMFVIDNSVSMYNTEQMIAAGYSESTGAIGNDTTFKRLTLTNKMIDMFTGNYTFGVAEFSGNYVNLSTFTDNTTKIKQNINSMESNWKSNADGTNIVSALKEGIDEFKSDENNHYLILLTDGKNTEGSLSYSKNSIISNAEDNNVKICVIGLGTEIDSDDLNEIAEATGCDYYSASDDSALDEIYSLMGADINYNYVDTDDDNEVDGMIVANSGFLVNRDGFSFANFSSDKTNGHCYGMAVFAMYYYKEVLPISMSEEDKSNLLPRTWGFQSNGYDLDDTYFEDYQNLYDYQITNEGLSYYLGDNPSDYRDRVEDQTWMIKEEYYNALKAIGATFSIKDYNFDDKDEKEFDKYQSALLTIDNDTFNNAVVKDESQLINAIWRLFILQADDERLSFSSSPDEAFYDLMQDLNDGTPRVLIINSNHAINAIRLIQDTDDSNKFKIEVYDNNFPGETRYIEVTRSKYSKWQAVSELSITPLTNTYNYTFMYDFNDDYELEDTTVQLSYPQIIVEPDK